MCKISKEACKKCGIETTDDERYFWINRRDLEIESDYKNWAQIFDKCHPKKQKRRYKLMPNTKFQRSRVFVRNDLAQKKIKSRRLASKQFLEFKKMLGLDPYKINFDEKDIINALQVAFEAKLCILNTVLKMKDLMITCLNKKLE